MPEVVIEVGDPDLRTMVERVAPGRVSSRRGVVITDNLPAAGGLAVAFVGWQLENVMRAIVDSDVGGILRPGEVTADRLTAIGNGSRVVSRFGSKHLDVDDRTYRAVAAAAQTHSLAEAAARCGYSERHLRRILTNLQRKAGLREFDWRALAPLLERDPADEAL